MCKKTILITGATGFIGSHIIYRLLDMNNIHIVALSHNESKLNKMFGQYTEKDSFEYIVRDIGLPFDFESISANSSIDAVFHAASPISGKTVKERPVDIIRPNITASMSLLDGLVNQRNKTGINGRIIIFSSATVYGANSPHDITVSEFDTKYTDGLDNTNIAYSESKRMAEVITQSYVKQYGVDAVIARLSWVYGSTEYPAETALYEFVNNVLAGNDIKLKTSDSPKRDNIYIDDAVSGLFAVLDKGQSGEAYNVSSGGDLGNFAAIDEIAEVLAKISKEELSKEVKVFYDSPRNNFRKPGIILDNIKLKKLGWKLESNLYDGLKNTLLKQAAKMDE